MKIRGHFFGSSEQSRCTTKDGGGRGELVTTGIFPAICSQGEFTFGFNKAQRHGAEQESITESCSAPGCGQRQT